VSETDVVSAPRVLIVEDEAVVAMDLEERLRGMGLEVQGTVSSGERAVAVVLESTPSLVLMDIHLRGELDGVSAAERIRAVRDVPIVFVTAHADDRTVARVRAVEPYGFLLKPFDERMLYVTVTMALHNHAMHLVREAKCEDDARLAAILDHMPNGALVVDEQQRILVLNRSGASMFGYTVEEAVGMSLDELVPEEHRGGHAESVRRFLANEVPGALMGQRGPIEGRRKNGTRFPAEASIFHFLHDGRKLAAAIVRDITDRRKLEAQFVQAQRLEAVGRLAAVVAHDFNNVLTVIQIQAELLMRPDLPASARSDVEEITQATTHGSALARQLLLFSKQRALSPEVVVVAWAIEESRTFLSRLAGSRITTDAPAAAAAGATRVDPGQLVQILMNLVVNGRDAMPGGGVLSITAERVDAAPDGARGPAGPFVLIRVRDSGRGMDPATRARLFEPFFTTKGPDRGTGLGLASVRLAVEAAGGHVRVETSPGEGTTFSVYLPRVEGEQAAAALEMKAGRRAAGGSHPRD
jgi:PAS domain S-box-containing protein